MPMPFPGRPTAPGLLLLLAALGCASAPTVEDGNGRGEASPPTPERPSSPGTTRPEPPSERLAELEADNAELRRQLVETREQLARIEESHAVLELELASALDEAVRAKASVRGIHNRALAVSRISEVRVELQQLAGSDDTEVRRWRSRAAALVARADSALQEENFSGAVFLAERASDSLRRARAASEIRSTVVGAHSVPIVPPRPLSTNANANLRDGPGTDYPRIGGLSSGAPLKGVARAGDWYLVETEDGARGWIYRGLVDDEAPTP